MILDPGPHRRSLLGLEVPTCCLRAQQCRSKVMRLLLWQFRLVGAAIDPRSAYLQGCRCPLDRQRSWQWQAMTKLDQGAPRTYESLVLCLCAGMPQGFAGIPWGSPGDAPGFPGDPWDAQGDPQGSPGDSTGSPGILQ